MERDTVISAIITLAVIIIIAAILYFSIPESGRNIKKIGDDIYGIFEEVFGIKAKKDIEKKQAVEEQEAIVAFEKFVGMLECSKRETECICSNPGLGYEIRFSNYVILTLNHPEEEKVSVWLFEQSPEVSHLTPASLKNLGKTKPVRKKEVEGISLNYASKVTDKVHYTKEDIFFTDSGGILGAPYMGFVTERESSSSFEDLGYPKIYSVNENDKAIIGTETKNKESFDNAEECMQKNNDLITRKEIARLEAAALNCRDNGLNCGLIQLAIPENYIVEHKEETFTIYNEVRNNLRFSTFGVPGLKTYCYSDGLPKHYDKDTLLEVMKDGCVNAKNFAKEPKLLVSLSGAVYFIDKDGEKKNIGEGVLVTLNNLNTNEEWQFPWGSVLDYNGLKIKKTDINGKFSFAEIPEGTYILKVRSEEFGLIYKDVTLTGKPLDKSTEMVFFFEVEGKEQQVGLPPLLITESLEAKECILERGITLLSAQNNFKKIKEEEFNGKTYWQIIEEATSDKNMQLLLAAIMATESAVNRFAISSTGCAGLMQFCHGTAEGFPQYFKELVKCCPRKCSELDLMKNNQWDNGDNYACSPSNDDRFNPQESIKAAYELLNKKVSYFDGKCMGKTYSNKRTFGIAAYNGGEGTVCRSIISSGIEDPSWGDIVPYLSKHSTSSKAKEISCYPYIVGSYESYFSSFT